MDLGSKNQLVLGSEELMSMLGYLMQGLVIELDLETPNLDNAVTLDSLIE